MVSCHKRRHDGKKRSRLRTSISIGALPEGKSENTVKLLTRTSTRKGIGYPRISAEKEEIVPGHHNIDLKNYDVIVQRVGDNAGKPFIYHQEAANGVLYEAQSKRFNYYNDLTEPPGPKIPDNAFVIRTHDPEKSRKLTAAIEAIYSKTPFFYSQKHGSCQQFITQEMLIKALQKYKIVSYSVQRKGKKKYLEVII